MASMLRRSTDRLHPLSLDTVRPSMAKADLQNLDISWQAAIGRALVRARGMVGWSQKEAAAKVGVDAATYAKWENGEERHRPQFDRIFAVEELCRAMPRLATGQGPCWRCHASLRNRISVTTSVSPASAASAMTTGF